MIRAGTKRQAALQGFRKAPLRCAPAGPKFVPRGALTESPGIHVAVTNRRHGSGRKTPLKGPKAPDGRTCAEAASGAGPKPAAAVMAKIRCVFRLSGWQEVEDQGRGDADSGQKHRGLPPARRSHAVGCRYQRFGNQHITFGALRITFGDLLGKPGDVGAVLSLHRVHAFLQDGELPSESVTVGRFAHASKMGPLSGTVNRLGSRWCVWISTRSLEVRIAK